MPSLKMLDSLIAMVGVILILSLIVQSLQGALKKLLKIKSRQIEDSLLDLFENALGLAGQPHSVMTSSPVLRLLFFRKHPSDQATGDVKNLFDAVSAKFRDIGRVAQSGRWTLDSISKDDLLKILARVTPKTLLPDFQNLLQAACQQVDSVDATLKSVRSELLSGEASAKFALLRQTIDPLINDVQGIYKGNPKQLDPALLVGDAMRLREIKLQDLLEILTDLQKGVDRDLSDAQKAGRPEAADLKVASDSLKQLAIQLADMHSKFDLAIAPLRSRLKSFDTWFDTVMQSFEERYSRGMKTWALVLSLLVVVLLNANFFKIANQILAADPATLSRQVDAAQKLVPAKSLAVQQNLASYNALGFGPLIWDQSYDDVFPKSLPATLAGWLLMTMLLSVGAPFWEDTLESLFGIKNLLRKNTSTKNVEQGSGEGNPKL